MPGLESNPFILGILAAAQRVLRPLNLSVPYRVAGHRIHFDPATDIGAHLLVRGGFEAEAIDHCARFIRSDGVVIDVGANIGVHSIHYAASARNGTVIALEPARMTFEQLLRNVRDLPNVIPLNIALSNSTGLQRFFVAADNAYSGLKDTGRKAILREELVACQTGDQLLLPLLAGRRVDLIKIDVEGFETQVLEGMRQLLLTQRPTLFCEIFGGGGANPDPQATVALCLALGYTAHVLKDGQLQPAGPHDDRFYKYFFIHPQRAV
jgi:FkbM family methyltransferase